METAFPSTQSTGVASKIYNLRPVSVERVSRFQNMDPFSGKVVRNQWKNYN